MASNALNLGSLFVELKLEQGSFNTALAAVYRRTEGFTTELGKLSDEWAATMHRQWGSLAGTFGGLSTGLGTLANDFQTTLPAAWAVLKDSPLMGSAFAQLAVLLSGPQPGSVAQAVAGLAEAFETHLGVGNVAPKLGGLDSDVKAAILGLTDREHLGGIPLAAEEAADALGLALGSGKVQPKLSGLDGDIRGAVDLAADGSHLGRLPVVSKTAAAALAEDIPEGVAALNRALPEPLSVAVAGFETLLPPMESAEEMLLTGLPDAATQGLGGMLSEGSALPKLGAALRQDIPDAAGESVEAFADMRENSLPPLASLKDAVDAATGSVNDLAAAPEQEPASGFFGRMTAAATDFNLFLNGEHGLKGTWHQLWGEDFPAATGDFFADLVSTDKGLSGAFRGMTADLKRIWRGALSDMFADYLRELYNPIADLVKTPPTLKPGGDDGGSAPSGEPGGGDTGDGGGGLGALAGLAAALKQGGAAAVTTELLGAALRGLGFQNVGTPGKVLGAFFRDVVNTENVRELRPTGKRVDVSNVPTAALVALFGTPNLPNPNAVRDWRVYQSTRDAAIYTLHPTDTASGTVLRGVYLTGKTQKNIPIPNDIAFELLQTRALRAADIGLPLDWEYVALGQKAAVLGEDGGVGFVDTAANERTPNQRAALEAHSGTGTPPAPETPVASLSPPPPSTSAAQVAASVRGMNLSKLSQAATAAATGMEVFLNEILQRDPRGQGVMDVATQGALSQSIVDTFGQIVKQASSAGIGLSEIPLLGAPGLHVSDILNANASGSAAYRNNVFTVNVDKFFGTESELRQLMNELLRLARQEGLVLQGMV